MVKANNKVQKKKSCGGREGTGFKRNYSDIFDKKQASINKKSGSTAHKGRHKKNRSKAADLESPEDKEESAKETNAPAKETSAPAKADTDTAKADTDTAKADTDTAKAATDTAKAATDTAKASGKAKKLARFILFVGNLSYTTTKESLEKHFEKAGPLIAVRLLLNAEKKPRGCAFVEYKTSAAMLNALLYHHTTFEERKINVEMTCGGGGNSAKRKKKIADKRNKSNELIHKMLKQKKATKAPIK